MAAASNADFEGDLDRLYQLPLSEFTSARDELVKRLRAQGERERAQEIKTLRKPTAAVWLVNQLARERPLDVQRLLKAGESLTKSQAKAAAGKSRRFPRRDEMSSAPSSNWQRQHARSPNARASARPPWEGNGDLASGVADRRGA